MNSPNSIPSPESPGLPQLRAGLQNAMLRLRPPPDQTVSQWANLERKLSKEGSAEPGQFSTARAPYQVEPMDCFTDINITDIVLMCSSQVMKTEIMNNMLGYAISRDPGPAMFINPTLEMADAHSKERLSPMLRDTPCLTKLIQNPRAKDSTNTIRHKTFDGGFLAIAGANSPVSLAARPVRYLFCDEVDRFPFTAGKEGDPISLARRRTQTFWNRKRVYASTPTIRGLSRIESLYADTDQREYYVPCPVCGHKQTLKLGGKDCDFGLKWEPIAMGKTHMTETVWYKCESKKGCRIEESDKHRMITLGEWRAHAPLKNKVGFKIGSLYSPWKTWQEIVEEFLEDKKLPETFKTFVNTILGELWEEPGDKVDTNPLMARREHYGPAIPDKVLLITAGVDVQDDRLVVRFNGYGTDWEQWLLDYFSLPGDPAVPDVWKDLDNALARTFTTESGVTLRVVSAFIDSGGHRTQAVYDYVRTRQNRRIFACKGSSIMGMPVVKPPRGKNKKGVLLHTVGTDSAKEILYSHLRLVDPGPGYCHFPFKGVQSGIHIDQEFFNEQTAEKAVTRYRGGHPVRMWEKVAARNEALDCDVYALASARNLNPNFKALTDTREQENSTPVAEQEPTLTERVIARKPFARKKRGGFVKSWKK